MRLPRSVSRCASTRARASLRTWRVSRRNISPPGTGPEPPGYSIPNLPIIPPLDPAHLRREQRLDHRPLKIRQIKTSRVDLLLYAGSESQSNENGNPVNGYVTWCSESDACYLFPLISSSESSARVPGRGYSRRFWSTRRASALRCAATGSNPRMCSWRRCFGSHLRGRHGAIHCPAVHVYMHERGPLGFGNWNTIYRRFRDWARAGVFERIFNAVSDGPDMEMAMVDATIVKVDRAGRGAKRGLSVRL